MSNRSEYELNLDEVVHFKALMTKLKSMREENKCCDVIISVDGKDIHAHKNVICAASNYFDAMFSHDTLEKQRGVIAMKDVKYYAVEKCIEYIYSGKLSVSVSQCDDLLTCASIMQLIDASEKIENFLKNILNVENFYLINDVAIKFSLNSLKDTCSRFASFHIGSLSKIDHFNSMDLSFVSSLISLNSASITEDDKLACAIQWVNSDLRNREAYLTDLLYNVQAPKLTPGYCKYLMEEERLCNTSIQLVRHLFLAVSPSGSVTKIHPGEILCDKKFQSANSLILFDCDDDTIFSFSPSNRTITPVHEYHEKMNSQGFWTCSFDNILYVVFDDKKVLLLDMSNSNPEWRSFPDTEFEHGDDWICTIYDSHIYVGGDNRLERCNLIEAKTWEEVDLAQRICDDSEFVEYQDSLFIIGGRDEDGPAAAVTKFHGDEVTNISPMNIARCRPGAVVFGHKLFVGGGIDDYPAVDLNVLESYDSRNNVWTTIQSTNLCLSSFKLFVIDYEMYAVSSESDDLSIKALTFETMSWTAVKVISQGDISHEDTVIANLQLNTMISRKHDT